MRVRISVAERQADILRCQYFIAELYNKHFEIMFSEDMHDLGARIEPYPHRYLMAVGPEQELVGVIGLYVRETYVERYGEITAEDIDTLLAEAGQQEQYRDASVRELTKLVVRPDLYKLGLARALHEIAHCPDFLRWRADGPVLLTFCAKVSLIRSMLVPVGRISSRFLAPFPRYPIHDEYSSNDDPMESHLVIPELDVPQDLLQLHLPVELELPFHPGDLGKS